jgi:aspartyl-tRNA(Asn)/glutamyl-tRNA(Gln) amidotransferase subunit B
MAFEKTEIMNYYPIIGLEVHLELDTKSKVFCGCSTQFGNPPNTQVCPVCLGLPGSLPVLNKDALSFGVKVALALNCSISNFIKFDRKNYFYPDLPKNFQISQYDKPLSQHGYLDVEINSAVKRIGIRRVHLEEDTGKLFHSEAEDASLIDFNRSGIPLLEIVSEPDINSPDEAYEYLKQLKAILEYLDVSDCDMEKGSLRCDANISVSEDIKKLGTKTEIKNMNSFKAVRSALAYEIERQIGALKNKERIIQETRLWDDAKAATAPMRSKEEAHDYRYFPEPDLVPFVLEIKEITQAKDSLPQLPAQRKKRLIKDCKINEYDAGVLTQDKALADYFELCTKIYDKPKVIANWLLSDIAAMLNSKMITIKQLNLPVQNLVEMLRMIDANVISGKMAKDILLEMVNTGKTAKAIIEEKGLRQISDLDAIKDAVGKALKENPGAVEDFKKGKEQALIFLVGQIMKYTKGKANPAMANKILRENLENSEA